MPDPVGHSFGNLEIPEGQFGPILTPDDIRSNLTFWGIDPVARNGAVLDDNMIKLTISAAIAEFQRTFNHTLVKTRYAAFDRDIAIPRPVGVDGPNAIALVQSHKNIDGSYDATGDYDESTEPQDFERVNFQHFLEVKLKRRPILTITNAVWVAPTMDKMINLNSWRRESHKSGVVRFFPDTSVIDQIFTAGSYPFIVNPTTYDMYPHSFWIDFTAGYQDASRVPNDFRMIVADLVSLRLLPIVGIGLQPGIANTSLTLQGISESTGTTQTAQTHFLSGATKAIVDRMKSYIDANKLKITGMMHTAL